MVKIQINFQEVTSDLIQIQFS